MCGIVGFVANRSKNNSEVLQSMMKKIVHRGPDASGSKSIDFGDIECLLGHLRLSILDLSKLGNQPMTYGDFAMVYNGEVYNFREIRKELIQKGYHFESDTDSEVVLKCFDAYGVDRALELFNGMFAIALVNKKTGHLYLIRDRAGVKPLFYTTRGAFMFASDLSALAEHPKFDKSLSQHGLQSFFERGYILFPYTIYQDVFKLPPGHYLRYSISENQIELSQYWSIYDYLHKDALTDHSEDAILKELEDRMIRGFNYRMISDVPVGIFLSGGVDSSLVTAIIAAHQKKHSLNTFTIGYKNSDLNESEYAKRIAAHLGTNHTEYIFDGKAINDTFDKYSDVFDEPNADPSFFPSYIINKMASNQVTVCLSADGGDELFYGYPRFLTYPATIKKVNKLRLASTWISLFNKFNKNTRVGSIRSRKLQFLEEYFASKHKCLPAVITKDATKKDISNLLSSGYKEYSRPTAAHICGQKINSTHPFAWLSGFEFMTYMNDLILAKVDRCSMHFSMEVREPFLDKDLMEFAASIPRSMHLRNGQTKYLSRKILNKYMPDSLLFPKKQGFAPPIIDWMRSELKSELDYYTSDDMIRKVSVLELQQVRLIKKAYQNQSRLFTSTMYRLLCFQKWAYDTL